MVVLFVESKGGQMKDYEKNLSYRTTAMVSNNGEDYHESVIVYLDVFMGEFSALDITGVWWSYVKDIKEGEFEI